MSSGYVSWRGCNAGQAVAAAEGATLLFVYGTLRHGFPGAVARWLQRKGHFQGSGYARGRLYDAGAYPVMVVSGRIVGHVRGDVYLLERPEALLARLDRYEGCSRSARPPGEYRRERLNVTLDDGSVLTAWAYLYRYRTRAMKRITDGDYLRYRLR